MGRIERRRRVLVELGRGISRSAMIQNLIELGFDYKSARSEL